MGKFVRILNYFYIDARPHKLLKIKRGYRAYETLNNRIIHLSSGYSKNLQDGNLDRLIHFIREYIKAFSRVAYSVSSIKKYHLEIIKLINYLLRFGMFIYRNQKMQKDDVDLAFSFLTHICDLFTNKKDLKYANSLDRIIGRDTVQTDLLKTNPFERAGNDIKYTLFNTNFNHSGDDNDEEIDSLSTKFRILMMKEIASIFHLFNDLRQNFLMYNNVEFFHKQVYLKYKLENGKDFSKEQFEEISTLMQNEFPHLLPWSKTYRCYLDDELPSIESMFENNEIIEYMKKYGIELDSNFSSHKDYPSLVVDMFNLYSEDPFLRQLIMLLICRFFSRRSEFIRNVERIVLFFHEKDWMFYNWIQDQLEVMIDAAEKSNIWMSKVKSKLINNESIADVNPIPEFQTFRDILSNLMMSVCYSCNFEKNPNTESWEISQADNEKRINSYTQDLFRNLKVYDYLIDIFFQNKELLIMVRKEIETINNKADLEVALIIKQTFREIFKLLEACTIKNPKTQEKMWKYKEEFVLKELGSIERDGELDLVLSIIDDSTESLKYNQQKWTVKQARSLINALYKRIGNEKNFTTLLKIFNKMIKFDSNSFLRQPLTKLILKNLDSIHTFEKSTRSDIERVLNIQEIISSIASNREMLFMRDVLKDHFPLSEMFTFVDQSIATIDRLEETEINPSEPLD
mmetsp:Transcript_1644/g.2034  ORF Transcript_1644/g.2034 Transcript_1644/m.2034 type:complete len:685 (-) Transcript_1644:200-2254(-)